MQRAPRICSTRQATRGFSLTELLATMAIVAILTGLVIPAFRGVTATSISAGVQRVNDMLSQARSEAIVRQAPCRVAIVTKWDGNPRALYRAITLWKANPQSSTGWEQITSWNYLPEGSVFDPNEPSAGPTYNSSTPDYLFDSSLTNTFTQTVQGEQVEMRYIEFLPSGAARTGGAPDASNLWVRVAEGVNAGTSIEVRDNSSAYADVVTDGLIGRVKTYRP